MSEKLLKQTRDLWVAVVKNEDLLEEIEPDTVRGAVYAELALRKLVTLTDEGLSLVEEALDALTVLTQDADDEEEDDE